VRLIFSPREMPKPANMHRCIVSVEEPVQRAPEWLLAAIISA